jgi:hypothetical protein
MVRIYHVNQTQWGYQVDGPNGHRWICPNGESETRAMAFAKALERAYAEGAKAMVEDAGLLRLLTAAALSPDNPEPSFVTGIRTAATEILRHIERIKYLGEHRTKKKEYDQPEG